MSPGPEVVVAGGGIAAAATAVRLRSLGVGVRLLVRAGAGLAGLEALPQPALALFDVLGEPQLVAAAGGVETDGPGHRMVHVDRRALARVLFDRAVSRGAAVETVTRLPAVAAVAPPAVAAVDATGRAAAWSRPLLVDGHDVAWQFEGPPQADLALRVVQGDRWWAYRLGNLSRTWAGVVGGAARADGSARADGPGSAAAAVDRLDRLDRLGLLGLDPSAMTPRGRRPARVQRAVHPVAGRRIAVGDAALAHDPIAGGGIRFALASAVAAATAIATWVDDPSSHDLAVAYYDELVTGEHHRHLAIRDAIHRGTAEAAIAGAEPAEGEPVPEVVRFTAAVVETPLVVDGVVRTGPAVRLPDGTLTRWLGSFDLLVLVRLAAEPVPRIVLLARLQQEGLDLAAARSVLSWAVRHELLGG